MLGSVTRLVLPIWLEDDYLDMPGYNEVYVVK